MAAAIVFFIAGLGLGILIGRRLGTGEPPRPSTATATSARVAAPDPAAEPSAPVLNAKARKAGLTEEAFTPADDILEQLRRAAEGDESALTAVRGDAGSAAPEVAETAEAADAAEPVLPPPDLTEAERRVLERLRRQQEEGDAGSSTFS